MKNRKNLLFPLLVVSIMFNASAQVKLSEDPATLFKIGDYVGALNLYLKLEKEKPEDLDIQYHIAECYLNMHDDRSRAVPHFAKCYNKGFGGSALKFDFGRALLIKYDFEGAKEMFADYATTGGKEEKETAELWMSYIKNAKELLKHPVHVKFENLGKNVNSPSADYYPFVTENEGTLYFTSRRKETVGNQISSGGYFSSDIFFSKVINGQWVKAKNMGPLFNTPEDEECVAVSPDGKKMLVYAYHDQTGADIFSAEYPVKGKNFARATPLPAPVNTAEGEFEACYGADGNTIYFVSDREGGLGETDIYISRKLPTGNWGVPQLLNENVNTKYKEGFPHLSADGKTLFFASQGHNSMGGFDIFKCEWDSVKNEWGTAVNVGYPLNTTDDDMMFSLAANGRDGYISAWKKDGFGDLDIYKVIFTDVPPPLTAIHGIVNSENDSLFKTSKGMTISITDLNSKKEIETRKLNPATGKYVFIVSPGNYRIDVKCPGFNGVQKEISVYDKSDYTVEKSLDIQLISPVAGTGKTISGGKILSSHH